MYKLFNNKQVYEKDEVDNAIEGVVSTAATASNNAASALAKADTALAETGRIADAYNMAEQAFNKMDTYDTAINDTLTAAANATTLAMAASERSLEAKEKAELAYVRMPIKYIGALPATPQDMIYGIRNTTPVTESRTTTFVDIIGTYFRTQSTGKYVLKDEYEITVDGTSFRSVYVSKETVHCYTSRNFTDMLPTVYNTYDQYSFIITETVDRMDYYIGNAITGTLTQLAGFDLVINGYIQRTEKGAPGGVATLDTEGHILYSQLPVNATVFRGTWDASTGEYPTEHVTPGDFFIVTVAGTVDGVDYLVDDRIYWTGEGWTVTHAPEGVISINGQRGEITLTATDVGAMSSTNPSGTGRLSMNNQQVGNGAHSTVLGEGLVTHEDYGVAMGRWNSEDTYDALFTIGAGTSDTDRNTVMAVYDNYTTIAGQLRRVMNGRHDTYACGNNIIIYGDRTYYHNYRLSYMGTIDSYWCTFPSVTDNVLTIVDIADEQFPIYMDLGDESSLAFELDVTTVTIRNFSNNEQTIRYKAYSNSIGDYTSDYTNNELVIPPQSIVEVISVDGVVKTMRVANAIWN